MVAGGPTWAGPQRPSRIEPFALPPLVLVHGARCTARRARPASSRAARMIARSSIVRERLHLVVQRALEPVGDVGV